MSSMGVGYNDHYKNLSEEEKQKWNKEMILNQLPEDWKIHIGWMTPYFTIAVWYSILMARYQSYSVL